MKGLISLILAIAFFVLAAYPQTDDESEVIRVDTELIDVPVMVTDKLGKPITALNQKNFAVYENGKLQTVEQFSATAVPFEVALLLDTSGSTRAELKLIKHSAENFIKSLRPGDRVAIIGFKMVSGDGQPAASDVGIICPMTADRTELSAALERLEQSNGTPYYDALSTIVNDVFEKNAKRDVLGRRALVALTDGVDSSSALDFAPIKAAIESTGIVCYFIRINTRAFFEEGLLGDCELTTRFSKQQLRRYYRTFVRNRNAETAMNFCQLGDFERLAISKRLYQLADAEMKSLADSSSGKVFAVDDLADTSNAFKRVADEIGTKYSLGYYSNNESRDDKYRKILVVLKGLPATTQVRARDGYYIQPK